MRIRAFEVETDLEPVLELWRDSSPGIVLGRSDTPDELRRKLSHDPDLFLVAEEDGRVIGSVIGGYDGRRGLVYHLAVARRSRRKGVGRTLMDEVENRLRAKGCLKSYLLVTGANPDAIGYYRKLGWSVMDVTVMGKELR
jgi:ribosomal protein S18 acetylase RimI-like enzyme